MIFCNSASSNNLATDANTPCRLFNGIVEILVPAAACRRIYSTIEIQLHYTSVKSMFFCPAAELLVNSVYYRHLIVDLQSMPFILCISALSCLHLLVKYYFSSIYLWTLTIKFIFDLSLRLLLFSSVMIIEVVGVLYWKITDSRSFASNKTIIEGQFLDAYYLRYLRFMIGL